MIKKTLSLYANWRNIALFTVWAAAALFILAGSEGDSVSISLLLGKLIGFALAYIGMRLYRYWNSKGLMDELNDYCKEED